MIISHVNNELGVYRFFVFPRKKQEEDRGVKDCKLTMSLSGGNLIVRFVHLNGYHWSCPISLLFEAVEGHGQRNPQPKFLEATIGLGRR